MDLQAINGCPQEAWERGNFDGQEVSILIVSMQTDPASDNIGLRMRTTVVVRPATTDH